MSEVKKSLTVKDIALAISYGKSDEAVARTIRQVRHWTESDLLLPINQKQSGKGVPRIYEIEPTVFIAAVLLELCRYGVTVDVLKYASDALYEDWHFEEGMGGWYISTTMTDMNVFLQIAWKVNPETGTFTGADVAMYDDTDLAEEGKPNSPYNEGHVVLRDPSSSILINMTQIMERVYRYPWT